MPVQPRLHHLHPLRPSTGNPKGVRVAHRGPPRRHSPGHCRSVYEMGRQRSASSTSLRSASTVAHERLFTTLTADRRVAADAASATLWTPEQVTHNAMQRPRRGRSGGFPPVYLQQLADYARAGSNPPRCMRIRRRRRGECSHRELRSGSSKRISTPSTLHQRLRPDRNGGHADACGRHASARCSPLAPTRPIGRPIGDRSATCRTATCNRRRAGVAGELYLGGTGLARGYLNRAGADAPSASCADPLRRPAARLYRTGDLVRWRADGAARIPGPHRPPGEGAGLPHRARRDRGAGCWRNPAVREAAWWSPRRRRRRARLVALRGRARAREAWTRPPLRSNWRERCPTTWCPPPISGARTLPLTAQRQAGPQALPEPDGRPVATRTYEAPQVRLEQALAAIWQGRAGLGAGGPQRQPLRARVAIRS